MAAHTHLCGNGSADASFNKLQQLQMRWPQRPTIRHALHCHPSANGTAPEACEAQKNGIITGGKDTAGQGYCGALPTAISPAVPSLCSAIRLDWVYQQSHALLAQLHEHHLRTHSTHKLTRLIA